MSSLFTNAGVEVINYTRYNSSDLLSLINAVEEAIASHGVTPNIRRPHFRQASFTFRDYNPKKKWRSKREYDIPAGKMVVRQVRNYEQMTANWDVVGGTLGLIPPGSIYADAIEELSSVTQDVPVVPFEMLRVICKSIVDMYPSSREYAAGTETLVSSLITLPIAGQTVRIDGKRSAKKPQNDKNLEQRRKYVGKVRVMGYYAKRSLEAAERLLKDWRISEKHGKSLGMSCGPTHELERAIEILVLCQKDIRDNLNTYGK
jgi:hypothetical protein